MDPDANINPKTLEISFDNLCNLSCTYCNQEFSSTWQNDIKSNGIYKNMLTDGGKTYQNDGDHAYSFGLKGGEGNLFIKAFFKWFDNGLKEDLQELRVTGGEPTRSPDFWKLVDRCEGADFDFAVNSNLILDNDRMKKLIDASHKFVNFDLYTSCETTEDLSKLVRHGFDYTTWNNNLRRFVDEANFRSVSIMMTISALTLYTITDFMDNMIDLKRERKNKAMFHMSLNILRFPSFQSVNILSPELKAERADHIESWLEFNRGFLTDSEASHILRLVQYLRNVDISYEDTDTQEDKLNDFVRFFRQYTKRRNLDLPSAVNHEMFTKWWEQINKEVGYVG
jgi:organic radical activating enzyme